MKEHKRLIVKFPDSSKYYEPRGTKHKADLKRLDGSKIKTIISDDDYMCVANQNIKLKIYADGRLEIEKHDNTQKLECK